jgi:hypothetical protein
MMRETFRIFRGDASTGLQIAIPNAIARQQITILPVGQNTQLTLEESFVMKGLTFRLPPSTYSDAFQTMLASEDVLRRDWDQPEEDAAWEDL